MPPVKRNRAYEVIDYLKRSGATMGEDLMHELGMRKACAGRHLRELWALDLIHICSWDRQYQQWVPVYRWGNKDDAAKPRAYTNAETRRRYVERRDDATHGG